MKVKDYFRINVPLLTDLTRDSPYWERAMWFYEDNKEKEMSSLTQPALQRLLKIETQLFQQMAK